MLPNLSCTSRGVITLGFSQALLLTLALEPRVPIHLTLDRVLISDALRVSQALDLMIPMQ